MTVFYCTKCGVELTPDLVKQPSVPEVSDRDKDRDKETGLGPSTVPRGHYAVDPEPWGAPFTPPADEPRPHHPRQLLMPPAPPYELHLDPARVWAFDTKGSEG